MQNPKLNFYKVLACSIIDGMQNKNSEIHNLSEKKIPNVPEKHLPITPLTRQELHDAANARVSLITKEFTEGFNFLRHYPKSVTFFGSARFLDNEPYYIKAREIATRIAEELHYSIFTGGGPGIMEAANRGAFETGGESLGLTIDLPAHQITNNYLTKSLELYYFFTRKVCLSFSAEAYLFFPGGLGTLDEFFEIITLVQTHKIEQVPIILVGSDFWNSIDMLLRSEMLSRGTIDEEDLSLYTITDNDDEILSLIKKSPVRNGIKFEHVGTPAQSTGLGKKNCIPCEGNVDPLDSGEANELLSEIHNWNLIGDEKIEKVFDFQNFTHALLFVNNVGKIAEEENHHPDIAIVSYKHVKVTLSTHAIGGLSENDFIMAAKIDELRRG